MRSLFLFKTNRLDTAAETINLLPLRRDSLPYNAVLVFVHSQIVTSLHILVPILVYMLMLCERAGHGPTAAVLPYQIVVIDNKIKGAHDTQIRKIPVLCPCRYCALIVSAISLRQRATPARTADSGGDACADSRPRRRSLRRPQTAEASRERNNFVRDAQYHLSSRYLRYERSYIFKA